MRIRYTHTFYRAHTPTFMSIGLKEITNFEVAQRNEMLKMPHFRFEPEFRVFHQFSGISGYTKLYQ